MKKIIFTTVLALSPLMAQVSQEIVAPDVSYTLKDGKGLDSVQANCSMCHSFGYILNQGNQSHKFWDEKVHKMINAFKAPIAPEDIPTIVGYLSTTYGNGK